VPVQNEDSALPESPAEPAQQASLATEVQTAPALYDASPPKLDAETQPANLGEPINPAAPLPDMAVEPIAAIKTTDEENPPPPQLTESALLETPAIPIDAPEVPAPPVANTPEPDKNAQHEPTQRLPTVVRSLLTLSIVAVSVTMLVYQLALPREPRLEFLLHNTLGKPRRMQLLIYMLASFASVNVIFGIVWLFLRQRLEKWIEKAAILVGPLVIAGALPSLFIGAVARQNPTVYLVWLCIVTLLFRSLLTRSIECFDDWSAARIKPERESRWRRLRMPGWGYALIVVLAATGYSVYMGWNTIRNHQRIQTMAFDLGIYDNLMYNALHGRPFHAPILFGPGDKNYIAGHAEYAMLLFVPIYAIKPGPEVLLVLQAVLMGFAAVPLYFLAKRFLTNSQSMILALVYLFYAPLHGPNFYDFHWLPLAIFFHFFLYWAIVARKTWLVVINVLILFSIREDIPVGLASLGAFLFLTGVRQRLGIVLATTSTLWFGLNKFVIMPRAGTWWFANIYKELFADGNSSYGSVIQTMITNPSFTMSTVLKKEKLEYALHLLVPLGLLPVRRSYFLLLLFPAAMFTILTTGYAPTVSIAFQYTTHAIPYLFLAMVLGLHLMKEEPRGRARVAAAVVAVLLAALSQSRTFGGIIQHESFTGGFSKISFSWTPAMKTRYDELRSITALIPPEASVAATEYVNPHISTRAEAYCFRADFGAVDYIFVSKAEVHGASRTMMTNRLSKTPYGLVKSAGEFYLFKRDHFSPNTAAALQQLDIKNALPVKPSPATTNPKQ